MQILTGIGKEPLRLAFSPKGRFLLGCDSKSFHMWDLHGVLNPIWSKEDDNWFGRNLYFSADEESLVGGQLADYRRYNLRTGEWNLDPGLVAFRPDLFSPDGQIAIAVEQSSKTYQLRCLRATLDGHWEEGWKKRIMCRTEQQVLIGKVPLVSADSSRVAWIFARGPRVSNGLPVGVHVVAAESGNRVSEWEGELPCRLQKCAISPSGTVVVLNARNFYAVETSTPRAEPIRRQNTSSQHFTSAAFSCAGSRLATTSNDTTATVWDTTTWEVRRRYEWQIGRLRTVCFAPDGLRCAAGSDSGQVVVWDVDE